MDLDTDLDSDLTTTLPESPHFLSCISTLFYSFYITENSYPILE